MSLVSHAFNAAVVGMILAPLSVADDPTGVSTNPEPTTTIPRLEVRVAQVPSGLKMRRTSRGNLMVAAEPNTFRPPIIPPRT